MPLLRSFDADALTLFRLLPWNYHHGGPPRFPTVRVDRSPQSTEQRGAYQRSLAEAPFIVDFMSTVPPFAETRRTHTNLARRHSIPHIDLSGGGKT
ncbi:hypothetical protein An08g11150 [Aspergillus niger]|uniref:Uncharacterized protein n=2 Tax=Aspergillus niger TaxID=5061 RepID=A2QSL4_ASPNC|nr:hypothetical protein An08g11150 [Aspergillus niger]CAK45786.1 hypothetical protein An08g11150 [Aspergillus niger]